MKRWNKRIFSLALAICLAASLLPAAVLAAEEEGERGTLTYTEVIAPQYTNAGTFSDGLAAVEKNGKWGYVDENNKTVISFRYDIAGIFNEGYAVVGTAVESWPETEYDWETDEAIDTGKTYTIYEMSFVDKQGKETPFLCNNVYNDETGELEIGPMTYGTSDEVLSNQIVFHNGYIVLPSAYEPGGYLFDTTGKAVDLPLEENSWLYPWQWPVNENIVILGEGAILGGSQHYLNLKTGQLFTLDTSSYIDAFAELRPFNQGVAWAGIFAWDDTTYEYVGKWGVVDTTGKFIIPPTYSGFYVNDIYGDYEVFGVTGLAMVENTAGKWGAVNKSGQTVIPFQYDGLYPYSFGLAAFEQNGKWGFLDGDGNVAISAQYLQTTSFSGNGYAVVYDGSKASLIDSKGNAIPGSDKLDPDTYFKYGEDGYSTVVLTPGEYVVIQENGKYGFGHISYQPALPEKSEMSSWAYEEVTAAIEEDLVPTYLQNLYLNNINRDEFCDLTIQAVSETLDKDIEDIVKAETGKTLAQWQQEYPFYDSTNSDVIAAYALGIVTGRGGGKFDPYATITRQEAAAFLARSAKVLGMDTSNVTAADFADGDTIGAVFQDSVNFVYQINVMNGTGGNNFSPKGSYTREQSYMTIYRLFQAVTAQ